MSWAVHTMDKKTAQKHIRKAAKDGEIIFAGTDRVEALGALVNEFVLKALDVKSAWVSDASQISDFAWGEAERKRACTRIFELYGISVHADDYIVDVVERISGGP